MYVLLLARQFRIRKRPKPEDLDKDPNENPIRFELGSERDLRQHAFPPEIPPEALDKIFLKVRPGSSRLELTKDIYGIELEKCLFTCEVVSYLEDDGRPTKAQLIVIIGETRDVATLTRTFFKKKNGAYVDSRNYKFSKVRELCGNPDEKPGFSRFRKYLSEFNYATV